MYINLQFFENCFSLKVPLNIYNAFSKTLSETYPGESGHFFAENLEKIINSHLFQKISSNMLVGKSLLRLSGILQNLTYSAQSRTPGIIKSMFFISTFSFLILFFTTC